MRTEDGAIIHRCLNGEPEVFGLLVDKYKEGIYAFVYAKLRDFRDAQDVTQEVFVQAYSDLRSLRRWESFVFWLYRIASARCGKWVRAQSRRPDREFIEDQDPEILDLRSLDSYRVAQASESLREALDSLPETYREALVLHYFGGMNSKEMAKALGTSPAAVRHRLSRARAQLREEMADMMGTTFEEQRLPAGFTFRVVEAVKQIKINPTPRVTALPWGLSLAAGIIVAILNFNPHLSLPDQISSPRGSPLPAEMKVLKTGEIPVEILEVSQIPAIAMRSEDGDGGEIRPADERGDFLLAPQQASEVKLKPKDGAAEDCLGYSVAVYGDHAIVGAYGKDDCRGAAYIFKRDGDSWREQQTLFADDGEKGDAFGIVVAISEDFAAVGAIYDDDKGEDTGSVYVFRRTGESWTQQAKLTPHGQLILWCKFGNSIAISGNYLVVGSWLEEGAGGATYIFRRNGDNWNEQVKLKSSNWARDDGFGSSVSISGDYVIAGASGHDKGMGSAYIFKPDGDIWKEQAILAASDGKAEDGFGISASISGDYAIVGACWHKDETGAAYIFVRDGTSWKQQAKLMPGEPAVGDRFGVSVCIHSDYAIVGSDQFTVHGKGAVYGFRREGSSWKQVSKQTASDGRSEDVFGISVALSGNCAIIGAPGANASGEYSGAAYIYNFADFFPVEPSCSSATTFGGEKDRPALPDLAIPPPARQSIPKEFRLLQNFPNPFNPETWIPYELSSDAHVVIQIHNSRGELVRKLSPGRQEAGFYTTRERAAYWDGTDEAGEQVASDVYFYTIQAGEFAATKKMVVAR